MKFNILPSLAVGIILLSGCHRGTDVSEPVPESTAGDYEYTQFFGSESAKESALSDTPAGIIAAEYTPDPIPETDINGNVSLIRNQFECGRIPDFRTVSGGCQSDKNGRGGRRFRGDDNRRYPKQKGCGLSEIRGRGRLRFFTVRRGTGYSSHTMTITESLS